MRPSTVALVDELAAEFLARCRCGHWKLSHAHDHKHRRSYCTHGDSGGLCPCQRYEAVSR